MKKLAQSEFIEMLHRVDGGYVPTEKAELKIANDHGYTIAHVLAERRHLFKDPEIRNLTTDNGVSVAATMLEFSGAASGVNPWEVMYPALDLPKPPVDE